MAGPLVTLAIVVAATAAALLIAGGDSFWDAARLSASAQASPVEVVVSLLVTMNLFLLVFNLVPAFPLDGGRIARAAAWRVTGDRNRATRFAARIGIAFGWLLIGLGIALFLFGGGRAAFDAIWFVALGFLLAQGAKAAIAQTAFTERLAGITVADIMDADPVTIPAGAARAPGLRGVLPALPGLGLVRRGGGGRPLRGDRPPRGHRARRPRGRAGRRGARRGRAARPRASCPPTRRWRACSARSRCAASAR